MSTLVQTIEKYLYPDFQDNWYIFMFRNRINKYLKVDSVVLYLGAGDPIAAANV